MGSNSDHKADKSLDLPVPIVPRKKSFPPFKLSDESKGVIKTDDASLFHCLRGRKKSF